MKFTCLFVVLVDVVVVAALIVRAREAYLFAEISRFTGLGREGGLSQVERQKNLQQSTEGPVISPSTQNDISASLETIPVIPPTRARPKPDLNMPHLLPNRGGPVLKTPGKFTDPLLMENAAALATTWSMAAPVQNFAGLNNVNGVLPPDTNGDVGSNHYMQWINVSFAIYSKSGTLLFRPRWNSAKQPPNLTTAEQSYLLGSPADNWGHAWTLSQLSNTNFRVRLIDVSTSTSRDFSLDWISVRITYC